MPWEQERVKILETQRVRARWSANFSRISRSAMAAERTNKNPIRRATLLCLVLLSLCAWRGIKKKRRRNTRSPSLWSLNLRCHTEESVFSIQEGPERIREGALQEIS